MNIPIELERAEADLSSTTEVLVELVYEGGKWRGVCVEPPVATLRCDTLEEALITAAREITREWRREPAPDSESKSDRPASISL
jgi:hypothetical protein